MTEANYFSDINECLHVKCGNGGTCLNNVGYFSCSCVKGFTGKYCEHGNYIYFHFSKLSI